ncbi:MAG: methanogen output domain 1-containing protein [Gammaproteobacteria bacterium]
MHNISSIEHQIAELDIPLERDLFMRTLVRELANVLEDTVGIEQASGFISVVGQAIGRQINDSYKSALGTHALNREQVAAVLADLKRRIQGDFYVVEQDDEKIILKSRSCPFAEKVVGQKTMCMMTSNVFGHITAENLGYARVQLQQTIAEGAPECSVAVYLKMNTDSDSVSGREYFQTAVNG